MLDCILCDFMCFDTDILKHSKSISSRVNGNMGNQ